MVNFFFALLLFADFQQGSAVESSSRAKYVLHGRSNELTLSLQAVQSNFISPRTPLAGNNGNPIAGLTTPIEVQVKAKKQQDKTTLKLNKFSFNITENGYLISQTPLPKEFSPRSAKWITFSAGQGIEGHVFRDGSIRFSGTDNSPLTPGEYSVSRSRVSFSNALYPSQAKSFFFDSHEHLLVRKSNFSISKGLSNVRAHLIL